MAKIVKKNPPTLHDATKNVVTGRPENTEDAFYVNTAPHRASTILFPNYKSFTAPRRPFFYGRFGTDSHRAFEESIGAMENATHVTLAPSGLSAISLAMLALAAPGDHILVSDNVYNPTRGCCEKLMVRQKVDVEFFDPHLTEHDLLEKIHPHTAFIFCESPGSLTFEIHDLPALARAAKSKSTPILIDSTWSSGLLSKPLALGADISIMSATKYIMGGSDALLGTIATNDEALFQKIQMTRTNLGINVSADDVFLAHRGLRTMGVRLKAHEETGYHLADLLDTHPTITRVIHPGRPDHPDYHLWQRDFTGANGLFTVELVPMAEHQVATFCDSLNLFGLGYSWGGFESLCIPIWPNHSRTAVPWRGGGPCMRFHAGLEDARDLEADLTQALDKVAPGLGVRN